VSLAARGRGRGQDPSDRDGPVRRGRQQTLGDGRGTVSGAPVDFRSGKQILFRGVLVSPTTEKKRALHTQGRFGGRENRKVAAHSSSVSNIGL